MTYGTVDSAVTGQPVWIPLVVAIALAVVTAAAGERLVHPAEVVIDSAGFRVRGEVRWKSYPWQDVENFRQVPRGWVAFDFVPGREPFGWHLVTKDASGMTRASRNFTNRTSSSTEDLVRELEDAKRRSV